MAGRKDDVQLIEPRTPPYPFEAYSHVLSPIAPEDGGGFLFTMPDLPGLAADGATEADAIADGRDAFVSVISALLDMGREVPPPTLTADDFATPSASGRFLARLPRSMHARLSARAQSEGVSLNTLVVALIAEGMGRREARHQ